MYRHTVSTAEFTLSCYQAAVILPVSLIPRRSLSPTNVYVTLASHCFHQSLVLWQKTRAPGDDSEPKVCHILEDETEREAEMTYYRCAPPGDDCSEFPEGTHECRKLNRATGPESALSGGTQETGNYPQFAP